jgi:hypothetical protein
MQENYNREDGKIFNPLRIGLTVKQDFINKTLWGIVTLKIALTHIERYKTTNNYSYYSC